MRIALFTDTFPPVINGVSRTLGRLVNHAQAAGHEVAVVSPTPGRELVGRGEGEGGAQPDVEILVPGVAFPLYPELSVPRPLLPREYRLLRNFDPDLVHVATESIMGWLGRRWARRRKIPLVTSFHTMFPDYLPGYGLGLLRRPLWRYLRHFHRVAEVSFAPSVYTLGQLRGHGFHDRFRIWSRGVDFERFRPQRRTPALRRELAPGVDLIVTYVGRLAWEKRLDVLLEAFKILRSRMEVRTGLLLVGDGPARKELERRAPPDTFFAGYRTGEALADAYAAGDVFLFPSDTETFGNVVTEALASGLPVVAANRGGQTDVVKPGMNGDLVAAGDARGFAMATLAILRNPELRQRLSCGARRTAEKRTWSAILDQVLRGYEDVLAGLPKPAPGPLIALERTAES